MILFKFCRGKYFSTTVLALLIIGGGILVRLRDVGSPPVETHAWRQTETAALARNYAEEGYRLFYPTVDWRGLTPGYVESELSIYAFVVALAYYIFGVHEIVARLITIGVWAGAAWLLFSIGRRVWGGRAGLLALFFFTFLSPFGIFFGRAIMGDMTAQMWGLLAIYALQRWQERGQLGWFWLGAIATALAALSKLPLLYLGIPIAAILLQRDGMGAWRRFRNWGAALGILGTVGAWYWHAYQMGRATGLSFGILSTFGESVGRWELLTDPGFYKALWFNFTWRLLTQWGVYLGIAGMLLPRRSRFEIPLLAWVLAVLFYLVFAGRAVLNQDYYTLALLPPAALWIGKALDVAVSGITEWTRQKGFLPKIGAVGLSIVGIIGLFQAAREAAISANQLFTPLEAVVQTRLTGQWVQAVTPEKARILAVGGGKPEVLYFSHRHGLWFPQKVSPLEILAERRWKYLVVFNPYWGNIDTLWLKDVHKEYRLIGGGPWFLAYDIQQKRPDVPPCAFDAPPQWADQIRLLGYELTPEWAVDSRLYVILYWRADRQMSRGYTAFLHAWDADGRFCGQDDHPPLNGLAPHDTWSEGEVFADPFQVDLSGCDGASELFLKVGLYIPETMERLPLTDQIHQDQIYTFHIQLRRPPPAR